MADNTLYGTHGFLAVIQGGSSRLSPQDYDILTLSVGSNIAKAGMVVTIAGETYPNCDLAITTDVHAYGIILGPLYPENIADYDIDTAITDGEKVRVLKIGGRKLGVKVAVILEATAGPVAVMPGVQMAIGTEAGTVRNFVYADATAATDSSVEIVGICATTSPGSTTDDLIIIMEV